jgi:hypothetical protein
MIDAFATLQLPRKATLTEDEVRAAYFALSKADGADHAELNAAYELLLAPEKRLRHLLDLSTEQPKREWQAVTLPEELMETFMALGRLRPEAEALIEKRSKAQSALSKALLEPPTFALRDQLEVIGTALDEKRKGLESALNERMTWQDMSDVQARFSYVAKWQMQVRELLLRLM